MIRNLILFALAVVLAGFPPKAFAEILAVPAESLTGIEKTAQSAAPSVVSIVGYKETPVYSLELQASSDSGKAQIVMKKIGMAERKASVGSGFFITSDGYIMTNRHVVDDASATYVVDTGKTAIKGTVVYKDPDYDLAVVKIEGSGYPVIPFSKSSIRVGDEIASVGDALGRFPDAISPGTVVSLDETVIAGEGDEAEKMKGLIETDAKLYPGNSGGPLLNSEGEAAGVNVAIVSGTDISFSIPADMARTVAARAGIKI